jgi:hypothetical protein
VNDHDGGTGVDSSNSENDHTDRDEIQDNAGTERLSYAGVAFWVLVGFLGFLGACVLIAVILVLLRGS